MRDAPFAKVVGVFVFGAGIVAVAAIVSLGLRQGWLIPRGTLWTLLESAEFVRPGDPVTLAGLTVGEIDRLALTGDLRIAAALRIERRALGHLREGTRARVEPPFLIGAGKVMLIPSRTGPALASGDTIPAETEGGLGALTSSTQRILARADSIAAHAQSISADLVPLTAALAHPDSAFRRTLRATADLLETVGAPTALVPALAGQGPLRRQVDSTLVAARAATENLATLLVRVTGLVASSDTLLQALEAMAGAAAETAPQLAGELLPLLQELRLTLEQTRASWILGGKEYEPVGTPGMGRMNP
ncbi:MAG: MlaD family protein [Candidatus Eisenbacteria bacterium]|nr:MlaD family protein [Candidatus Eisenbacteria bacterium]